MAIDNVTPTGFDPAAKIFYYNNFIPSGLENGINDGFVFLTPLRVAYL